jgi:hypothetical protein
MPYAGQIDNVRGEFSSADASAPTLDEAGARFTLYLDGTSTTTTIGATDQFVLTGLSINSSGGTQGYYIYGGSDDTKAGDQLFVGAAGTAQGPVYSGMKVAAVPGTYPKMEVSSGVQMDATIYGYIIRGTSS